MPKLKKRILDKIKSKLERPEDRAEAKKQDAKKEAILTPLPVHKSQSSSALPVKVINIERKQSAFDPKQAQQRRRQVRKVPSVSSIPSV